MRIYSFPEWRSTADTLHRYMQIVGKVKMARSYPQPEWGHITLPLSLNGFTTGPLRVGHRWFEISFDFMRHRLQVKDYLHQKRHLELRDGLSVQQFHAWLMDVLQELNCETFVNTKPQEMRDGDFTPFDQDTHHASYEKGAVENWFVQTQFAYDALSEYIAPYFGKKQEPALYWGTFDLSCVAFSGRAVPYPKPEAYITAPAFDEELFEVGFWPGDVNYPEPAFFAFGYPFAQDMSAYADRLQPERAKISAEMGLMLMDFKDAFTYADPKQAVLQFCRSAQAAVAGEWPNYAQLTRPLMR